MLEPLNTKQKKELLKILEKQFGTAVNLDCLIFRNPDGKLFLLSKKFCELKTEKLKINCLGLYFGKLDKGELRLSLEGAQIINPTKNFIELTKEQAEAWMKGYNVEVGKKELQGFIILRYGGDVVGCGKYKDSQILNYVPKERRLTSITKQE